MPPTSPQTPNFGKSPPNENLFSRGGREDAEEDKEFYSPMKHR
jgi:hypothetical protein